MKSHALPDNLDSMKGHLQISNGASNVKNEEDFGSTATQESDPVAVELSSGIMTLLLIASTEYVLS